MDDFMKYVSVDVNIRFGKPCIKDTRIAIADILSWLASGLEIKDIIEDFPQLKKNDILAALAYAAHRENITTIIAS